jgi:dsDNA-binding SOS-regulon protein
MDSEMKSGPLGDAPAGAYRGEVMYLFAFDVAYDMKREPIRRLLGEPVEQFVAGVSKRGPRTHFFYRPQMVNLPDEPRTLAGRATRISTTVKLFPVGAISIRVRVPFAVERLDDLVGYHEPTFEDGDLETHVRQLAERVRQELVPYSIGPLDQLREEEAYTVFCLDSASCCPGSGPDAARWLAENRPLVAALLTQEDDPAALSEQEVADSTANWASYYRSDLVVTDWDATLVIDEPETFVEITHVLELANVQLAELEAYDSMLDTAVDRTYRDLAAKRSLWRSPDVPRLREFRVDMARLTDELQNTAKFFGEWHLARIYQNIARIFHLHDWHAVVEEKLSTVDRIYQTLRQDQTNRQMVWLEATIVALFILDVILLLLGAM